MNTSKLTYKLDIGNGHTALVMLWKSDGAYTCDIAWMSGLEIKTVSGEGETPYAALVNAKNSMTA